MSLRSLHRGLISGRKNGDTYLAKFQKLSLGHQTLASTRPPPLAPGPSNFRPFRRESSSTAGSHSNSEKTDRGDSKKAKGADWKKILLFTLGWFPIPIIIWNHGYGFIRITGRSMQPTFNPDSSMLARDYVLVSRISRYTTIYRRGDVVTLWHPYRNELIVKRILALGGDVVKTLHPNPDKYVRIPEGHCWVEGDEPFVSSDSNTYGPVPLGLIDGRVDAILWPPSRIRALHIKTMDKRRVFHKRSGEWEGTFTAS